MTKIQDLRQLAHTIKNEKKVGGNTADRVGSAFEGVADALEGTEQIAEMDKAVQEVQQQVESSKAQIQSLVNALPVVQHTGDSTTSVMSQKAVTDAIQAEIDRSTAAEQAIIYDVSALNGGAIFESLSALLSSSNLSTLIPTSVRHGGMSIRFIQGSVSSSDNTYVQYRLMSKTFSTNKSDWQGVDDVPTAGSNNLVKSGGVRKELDSKFFTFINQSTSVRKALDGILELYIKLPDSYIGDTIQLQRIDRNYGTTGTVLVFYDTTKSKHIFNSQALDEDKNIVSFTNSSNVEVYAVVDWSKFPNNAQTKYNVDLSNAVYDVRNSPYIMAHQNIEHALTVANSISDFKGAADINGDGVSIYRNVGSKAIWNTTHKYAVIDFGTSLNRTLPIMSIMFYDFENKTCGNLHIGFYTAGTEFSNIVYDHLSPYVESVKYEGHKLLITFTDSCKHRTISVNEIATPNRQGNITSGETSFYASLPDGEWKDAKEVNNMNALIKNLQSDIKNLQSGIFTSNLYDQANNVGYISTNGTSISYDDNWRYTDYISVSPGLTIDCILQGHTVISSVTFYNASREVLQTNIASTNEEKIERTFTAPANSAFVRICGGDPSWVRQTYKQYANTVVNIWDEIKVFKKLISTPTSFGVLSPYAIYTTCNNVIPSQKGRNRNYSQAVYLDHLFNGLTKELNIRFKDNIDRIVFNAPMAVTDSNETSPAVTFNGGENIHEEEVTHYIHGKDIIETPIVLKHRSTLNSITSKAHPKVLCIGDSITYAEQANIPDDNYTQNYAYHLICKELFMKDKIDNGNIDYDITFLGIYEKQKTFTYKNVEHTVITHHEGIRGISLSQHLNGAVAQFKDDDTGKWSLRAWLNKYRTLNDDGERLSLGNGTGTLITSGNLQNIDVCTPTHVIIMLGANGGGKLSQWQQMVNTIKSEFPNMIIGIAIPDAAGTYFPSLHPNCNELCTIWNDTGSQGNRHNQQYGLQKMLQEYYGTSEQEENNIYMLPFFFVAPTAESVALRTVPLPDHEYRLTGNNIFYDNYGWHASTHVNGIGQTNWGYQLYSWIKYTIAKSIQ